MQLTGLRRAEEQSNFYKDIRPHRLPRPTGISMSRLSLLKNSRWDLLPDHDNPTRQNGLLAQPPGGNGRQLPVEWLVFGFPVTSLCLAFLNYKAERAITTLRSLLSAQESFRTRPADHPALELSAARRLIPSTG